MINYYSKTEVKAHNEGRVIYEMLNIWSVLKFLVVFSIQKCHVSCSIKPKYLINKFVYY